MITRRVSERIVRQLQERIDTLNQERIQGHSSYHFCHPMQLAYRQEKEKEIDDCNELIEILNKLEFE